MSEFHVLVAFTVFVYGGVAVVAWQNSRILGARFAVRFVDFLLLTAFGWGLLALFGVGTFYGGALLY